MIEPSEISARITLQKRQFRPGDEICGEVRIVGPLAGWRVDFADVILFWRTEGKGDRDECIVAVDNLVRKRGDMLPSVVQHPFKMRLSDTPWTYHGLIIKIHWYIGIYAQGDGKLGVSAEEKLVVHPRPEFLT